MTVVRKDCAASLRTAQIRRCRPDDLPTLIEIFRQIYPANPRLCEPDYLDWQFRCSPFALPSDDYNLYLLTQDEEITGCLGYLPLEYRREGQVHPTACTMNWYAVQPGPAGLRLITHFFRHFDHRFLIGLNDQSIPIYMAYRIPLLRKMPRWLAFLQPERVAGCFPSPDPRFRRCLRRSAADLPRPEEARPIASCSRFDDDEEFHWHHYPDITAYVRRTGRYLNWRYVDIPRHDYRLLRVDSDQFVVYRIETIKGRPDRVLRLLEWNVAPARISGVLADLIRLALESRTILVDFFTTAISVGRALEPYGFIPEKQLPPPGIPYLFRPINPAPGIALALDLPPHRQTRRLDFARWYITRGDSDLDRIKL